MVPNNKRGLEPFGEMVPNNKRGLARQSTLTKPILFGKHPS